jgi:hypothetical protein
MHEVAVSEQTLQAVEAARREGRSLWRVSSTVSVNGGLLFGRACGQSFSVERRTSGLVGTALAGRSKVAFSPYPVLPPRASNEGCKATLGVWRLIPFCAGLSIVFNESSLLLLRLGTFLCVWW